MTRTNDRIVALPIHAQAVGRASDIIQTYAVDLVLQAKLLASEDRAELVLTAHVDEARSVLAKREKSQIRPQLMTVVGGAFFGAFVQGFVSELSSGNAPILAVYTALGFVGLVLVFWGLMR